MTKREKISEQLSAYLDGELRPSEVRRVEESLRDDPALQKDLDELRSTRELIRDLPKLKAGKDFVSQVLSRAERDRLVRQPDDPQRDSRGLRWVRHAATAAVLLITASLAAVAVINAWPSLEDPLATQTPEADHRPESDVRPDEETAFAKHQKEKASGTRAKGQADGHPEVTDGNKLGWVPVPGAPASEQYKLAQTGRVAPGGMDDMLSTYIQKAPNIAIYTDDLEQAQRNVEEVLVTNGAWQIAQNLSQAPEPAPMSKAGRKADQTQQLQLAIVVPEDRVKDVVSALGTLRSQQTVTQMVVGDAGSNTVEGNMDLSRQTGGRSGLKAESDRYERRRDAEIQPRYAQPEATNLKRRTQPAGEQQSEASGGPIRGKGVETGNAPVDEHLPKPTAEREPVAEPGDSSGRSAQEDVEPDVRTRSAKQAPGKQKAADRQGGAAAPADRDIADADTELEEDKALPSPAVPESPARGRSRDNAPAEAPQTPATSTAPTQPARPEVIPLVITLNYRSEDVSHLLQRLQAEQVQSLSDTAPEVDTSAGSNEAEAERHTDN